MKRRASDGRPAGSEWWTAVIGVIVVIATSVPGISRRVTHPSRSYTLCRRALAGDEADDIAVLEPTAAEGFALLDRMEAEDAARGKNG